MNTIRNVIVNDDALSVLKKMPDGCIDLTFTLPPYFNAKDYSHWPTYDDYLASMEDIFIEVNRVTSEGRFLIVNSSPVIVSRSKRSSQSRRYPIPYDLHSRLVSNEWEFVEDIVWLKPDGAAKNRNAGFFQNRTPLAYKPNCVSEMLMVYRKKTDRLIDWNIKKRKSVLAESKVGDDYERTNVWSVPPSNDHAHPAVFPAALCERVLRYYSFVGDVFLDPFAGVGTLGKVARSLKRYYFMVEKDIHYFKQMWLRFVMMETLYDTPDERMKDFTLCQLEGEYGFQY